jgi:hypothetical protein
MSRFERSLDTLEKRMPDKAMVEEIRTGLLLSGG